MMIDTSATILVVLFFISIIMKQVWLFSLMSALAMGCLACFVVNDLIISWPPRTFLNGAQIFCFLPFTIFATIIYGYMFFLAITGQLD